MGSNSHHDMDELAGEIHLFNSTGCAQTLIPSDERYSKVGLYPRQGRLDLIQPYYTDFGRWRFQGWQLGSVGEGA